MGQSDHTAHFAPELFISKGVEDISFYEKAFEANERMRFSNDDDSIHVVELFIDGAVFHIREITDKQYFFSPHKNMVLQFVLACLYLTWTM
jgi:uncharacterized glyoxalase superfamily protein PhnB